MYRYLILLVGLLCMAGEFAVAQGNTEKEVVFQGHRGARGLLPENSIPGFLKALDLGVGVMEMDVVVSADKVVLVSHEPWFNEKICVGPDGEEVKGGKKKGNLIYKMPYSKVREYDCGCKGHPGFPKQKAVSTHKPKLEEAIAAIVVHAKKLGMPPPMFNIEIKSKRSGDRKRHPAPTEFAQLVLDVVKAAGVAEQTIIQSFDRRALQAVRALDPNIQTALLVANTGGIERNVKRLGFTPEYYSPWFKLVTEKTITYARENNIAVVVWTVNKEEDVHKMLKLGVDGIITDFPGLHRVAKGGP